MRVFKLFFQLARHEWKMIVLYIAMAFSIFLIMSSFSDSSTSYTPQQVRAVIFDHDDSDLSHVVDSYLEDHFTRVDIQSENEIEDALFYQTCDLVIIIPEDFEESFVNGAAKLDIRYHNYQYVTIGQNLINNYMNSLNRYYKVFDQLSFSDLNEKIISLEEKQASINILEESGSNNISILTTYFNFFSYSILTILLCTIGYCIISLRDVKTHLRMMVSSLSSTKLTFQMVLASVVFALMIDVVFYVGIFILDPLVFTSKEGWTMVINGILFTTTMTVFAMMVSMLVSSRISKNKAQEILTGFSIVAGLAVSFLSGAFVPQFLIDDILLKVASFTPSYWFIKTNDLLSQSNYSFSDVFYNMGILVLFMTVFILLCVVIEKKKKSQRESS